MPELVEFLESLSSADPVPGGGSVAALDAALAASLLAMVANLTLGRKRYADVQDQVAEVRGAARDLRDRAVQLVQHDSDAYRAVSEAMALPKDTDEGRAARARRVQDALQRAVDPPLDTMGVAHSVLALAQRLVIVGNRSAISDVGTAALAARSAYQAALLNVEINLHSITDVEWVAGVRARLGAMEDVDAIERQVTDRVRSIIGGNAA
ncbi:MAG: cyclodeaminase/cyclohydrolase family protein [Chloroflexota bacterium]